MLIPAARAAACAAARCAWAAHCSQEWNSILACSRVRSAATAAERGDWSAAGHDRQSGPWNSASAHQVAQSSSAWPSRTVNRRKAARRAGASGWEWTISSAARLAAHTASRSMRPGLELPARSGAARAAIRCRWPDGSRAYSGMSSTRRYSGLRNLRLIGRYGDALTGGTGSAACSGLISTKAAPSARPLQVARSARSRRSPWPQDCRDRTE
jgi:hypothetical protein